MSGGQQQRVALARALVKEPQLLLLDEPLSNLDASLRLTMRSEIRRLQRTLGVTTILVTHDQIEATTMADRIICMSKGRIEQIGTADDLYHRPDSLFVAGFIGSPPINLLPGEAQPGGIRVGEARLPIPTATAGKVVLGIRPEHVRLDGARSRGGSRISSRMAARPSITSPRRLGRCGRSSPAPSPASRSAKPSAEIVSSLVFDRAPGAE